MTIPQDETSATPPSREPSHAAPRSRLPTGFTTLRDGITFVVGMAILINEVFIQSKVEATSMAIGLAMTGLPLVFNADERRKKPTEPEE